MNETREYPTFHDIRFSADTADGITIKRKSVANLAGSIEYCSSHPAPPGYATYIGREGKEYWITGNGEPDEEAKVTRPAHDEPDGGSLGLQPAEKQAVRDWRSMSFELLKAYRKNNGDFSNDRTTEYSYFDHEKGRTEFVTPDQIQHRPDVLEALKTSNDTFDKVMEKAQLFQDYPDLRSGISIEKAADILNIGGLRELIDLQKNGKEDALGNVIINAANGTEFTLNNHTAWSYDPTVSNRFAYSSAGESSERWTAVKKSVDIFNWENGPYQLEKPTYQEAIHAANAGSIGEKLALIKMGERQYEQVINAFPWDKIEQFKQTAADMPVRPSKLEPDYDKLKAEYDAKLPEYTKQYDEIQAEIDRETAMRDVYRGQATQHILKISVEKGENALHIGNPPEGFNESEIVIPKDNKYRITSIKFVPNGAGLFTSENKAGGIGTYYYNLEKVTALKTTADNYRKYIKDDSEAPEGVEIQIGIRNGHFYDKQPGVHTASDKPAISNIKHYKKADLSPTAYAEEIADVNAAIEHYDKKTKVRVNDAAVLMQILDPMSPDDEERDRYNQSEDQYFDLMNASHFTMMAITKCPNFSISRNEKGEVNGAAGYKFGDEEQGETDPKTLTLNYIGALGSRRGIGSSLLAQIQDVAKQNGCDKIRLVPSETQNTMSFYDKHGFRFESKGSSYMTKVDLYKRYITKDPSKAPDGADIQTGPQKGIFYETDGIESVTSDTAPVRRTAESTHTDVMKIVTTNKPKYDEIKQKIFNCLTGGMTVFSDLKNFDDNHPDPTDEDMIERTKLVDKCNTFTSEQSALSNELTTHIWAVKEEVFKTLYHDEGGEMKTDLTDLRNATDTTYIHEGIDFMNKILVPEIQNKVTPEFWIIRDGERASASYPKQEVNISSVDHSTTIAHEIAHLLEKDPAIFKATIDFYNRRTEGNATEPLKDGPNSLYNEDEYTIPDKFIDKYTGKVYFSDNETGISNHNRTPDGQYATEILSMGATHLAENPAEFAEKDPDHFKFVMKVFRGEIK